jgi:hypothetical protein
LFGCPSKFTVSSNQLITTTAATSVTFLNKLSQITYGAGGPTVSVHACYSINGGSTWTSLYGGNGNCSGNGNAYGNAVEPNGTNTKTVNIATNTNVALKILGRYKTHGWLAFNETFTSVDNTGHVLLLADGDDLGNYDSFGNQTSLQNYLSGQGMIDGQGKINIGSCQALLVTELGTLGTSVADFQDDVMLVSFN